VLRSVIKWPLHWQILLALALALIAGTLAGETAAVFGIPLLEIFKFIGQLFLRLLKMLIVPLIASAIITGVSSLGREKHFGRLGLKTLGFYVTTTLAAVLVGLLMVNWIQPGLVDGKPIELGLKADVEKFQQQIEGRGASDVVAVFIRMIPENVVASASSNGEMLALIFFSILFGYFMGRIDTPGVQSLQTFWQGVYDVMLRITDAVMKLTPIGVFGLVASVAATTDLRQLLHLFSFFIAVLGGLLIHLFIVLPLMLRFVGKVSPLRHYRAMFPALLTAFSTSSSAATLPLTLECLQKNARVSNRTSSFVVPLGATVNMDGTALYECVAALFIAQLYGLQLTFDVQLITVVLALLTSIGVAGVPSASLVAIVVILAALGLPAEGIGVILVFDRILDMCRTAVNVFSDTCGAVIIARSEGEEVLGEKLKAES
jgi:proton glutamate symport protein